MRFLNSLLVLLFTLCFTTTAHALACVPMPTLENPGAMTCTEMPPIPVSIPVPDTTAPTILTIDASTSQTNAPYMVTVVFSEDVTGFDVSDIENLAPERIIVSEFTTINPRTYTFVVSGDDGSHRIHVKNGSAQDGAGNVLSPSENEVNVLYDTTPPVFSVMNAPAQGSVTSGPVRFDLITEDPLATFMCTFSAAGVPEGEPFSCAPGEFQGFSPSEIMDGTYTFTVFGIDEYGNKSIPTVASGTIITFTYDTTWPTVRVISPVVTPTSVSTPTFTLQTDEPLTLQFFGPCGSVTPLTVLPGVQTLTFNTLQPGTYSTHTQIVFTEGEEPTLTTVPVEGGLSKGAPEERSICYFSAADAAGNTIFHTLSTFVITESQPSSGGSNGPVTIVTGTPPFSGGSPVVLESSTTQPGNGGRVIIGQNSIVPSQTSVTVTGPTFAAAGGTAPTTQQTGFVTPTKQITVPQQRRVTARILRTNQPRTPRQQSQQSPIPVTPITHENQTASAAGSVGTLWNYVLRLLGY